MAHELESMMYVGATPWHGLGIALAVAPKTVAEALDLAGLNWSVSLESLMRAKGQPSTRRSVVRSSDDKELGTVGEGYHAIQNVDAFAPMAPLIESGAVTVETAGSLKGGSRVWMLAKVNRPSAEIVAGDTVDKYLLAATAHDGSLKFSLGGTYTRVVCQNTLSASLGNDGSGMIKIRHTAGANATLAGVADMINAADATFEKTATAFRALAGKPCTLAKLRAYVDSVFGVKVAKPKAIDGAKLLGGLLSRPVGTRESMFSADVGDMTDETSKRVYKDIERLFETGRGTDIPGVRGTAWGAYNAVTEYQTWEAGRSADNRLNNLWLTQGGAVAAALPSAVSTFLSA